MQVITNRERIKICMGCKSKLLFSLTDIIFDAQLYYIVCPVCRMILHITDLTVTEAKAVDVINEPSPTKPEQ